MSPTRLASLRGDLREFFLLEDAERHTSKFTPSQRELVRAYYRAGKRRLSSASALREPCDAAAGILLYREAWLCLARAILLSEDEHLDVAHLAPDVAWEELDRAIGERALVGPPDFEFARETLVRADPLALDRLTPDETARSVDALDATTRWLASLVESRSPRQLQWTRAMRRVAAVALACALLFGLVVWWLSPKNLAQDKPVQSTAAAYETTAGGAVDGVKNGRFGFHSEEVDSPWLTIDLEKAFLITTIKVFGRGECCFEQSIPLTLEVSIDGRAFRKIADRTVPFSEAEPWIVATESVPARFVRLRVERRGVLVLSEVEVYGKRIK